MPSFLHWSQLHFTPGFCFPVSIYEHCSTATSTETALHWLVQDVWQFISLTPQASNSHCSNFSFTPVSACMCVCLCATSEGSVWRSCNFIAWLGGSFTALRFEFIVFCFEPQPRHCSASMCAPWINICRSEDGYIEANERVEENRGRKFLCMDQAACP